MIWFKHPTNSSTHNQLVSQVESKFGLEGYARFYKMTEAVTSQMNLKEDDPTVEYAESKWCDLLKCKKKVLKPFLMYLRFIGAIECKRTSEGIQVRFLKLLDLLDNRSASSRIRASTGATRTEQISEKIHTEQKKQTIADDAEGNFSWLTDTLKGSNTKRDLPPIVFNHWRENGYSDQELRQVSELVRRQFSSSEKAQRHGEVVIGEIAKFALIAEEIDRVPEPLKSKLPQNFHEGLTQYMHLPMDKDKTYIAAYERCEKKTMTVADLVYIQAKAILLGASKPLAWAQNRMNDLARNVSH